MLKYFIRRLLYLIPTLFLVSVIAFFLIQLPPGTFVDALAAQMAENNEVNREMLAALEKRYGLDQPVYVQYYRWISGILLHGDFGQSFDWGLPVSKLIWGRLGLTLVLTLSSLIFVWVVSFPIGIYSALRKYSIGDYIATFIGFIGLATPNFLLALVMMYVSLQFFDQSVGGLFSPEYENADWSWAKVTDMLSHLWIPMIVIGTAGTAGLIRIMRANLLDELHKPYVTTARARGLSETRLIIKYPLRVALNPFVSTLGWMLPTLISGATITAVVLSLPTTGPMLLRALLAQDIYLAGGFIMMLSVLTVIGTLISDILLAWLDPRIRYE